MRIILLAMLMLLSVSCQSTTEATVTVSGNAVIQAVPDIIRFSVTASSVGATTEEARAVASGMMNISVSVLKKLGVSEEDITTSYFSVSPYYSYEDGVQSVIGQIAVERISVVLRNPEIIGDVIESLSKMDGIEISDISADKSDKSVEIMKARELAVQDAYSRATVYATAAGYTLGPLVSLSGEDDGYTREKVYALSGSGAGTEYHSGTIEVGDSVSAVFSLLE